MDNESEYAVSFAPQNLTTFDGWDDRDENQRQYQRLSGDARKVLLREVAPGVALYKLPTKYFLLDKSKNKLLYLVELKTGMLRGQRTVQQIRVWRYADPITKGLSEEVFFDHILPSTDLVITDALQTPAGRRFWELRVADAFARKLKIYLIDQNTNTQLAVSDRDTFDALVPNYYGDAKKYQAKRVAIGR